MQWISGPSFTEIPPRIKRKISCHTKWMLIFLKFAISFLLVNALTREFNSPTVTILYSHVRHHEGLWHTTAPSQWVRPLLNWCMAVCGHSPGTERHPSHSKPQENLHIIPTSYVLWICRVEKWSAILCKNNTKTDKRQWNFRLPQAHKIKTFVDLCWLRSWTIV